ncbi:MAG: hypothetical protein ABFD97_01350 [Syntrophobacter sp.]
MASGNSARHAGPWGIVERVLQSFILFLEPPVYNQTALMAALAALPQSRRPWKARAHKALRDRADQL